MFKKVNIKALVLWIIIIAVTSVVTAVCLLTNPKTDKVDALGGTIYFYNQATDEHETPVIQKSAEFGDGFSPFLKILKDEKWTDDNLVDRISHNYNGKISYSDNWIYFGYEQKVIYYDHYYCTVTDDVIETLKNLESEATALAQTTTYKFEDSVDTLKPSIVLCHSDGSFQFNYSSLSSYVASGWYEYKGNTLVLTTVDRENTYVFKVNDQKNLVFDGSKSSKIPEFRYSGISNETQSSVPDGAVFVLSTEENRNQNPYFNATVLEVAEDTVLVEPFADGQESIVNGEIKVSTNVISANPVPELKKGMKIRVVYNGQVTKSYPAGIYGVFAIYELDSDGQVIFETADDVKYIFDPVEICYSNGMYSYVEDVDSLPTYEIINDMELYEMYFNGPHNLYGQMVEIDLTQKNFDSRFATDMWDGAENLRKNNKTAWEVYTGHFADDISRVYLLLEQNDGTFYLAVGYYNVGSVNPANSDDSLIRWVYKLKTVDSLQAANPKW